MTEAHATLGGGVCRPSRVDADEMLGRLRQLVSQVNAADALGGRPFEVAAAGVRLADLFEALDAHLSGGGVAPDAWARAT